MGEWQLAQQLGSRFCRARTPVARNKSASAIANSCLHCFVCLDCYGCSRTLEDFTNIMNNLNLPAPKQLDISVVSGAPVIAEE